MRRTYVLVIEVKKKINIQIGKLGKFKLPGGWYLYIGSGENSLEKRIKRHLKKEKKLFWHIDYLLNNPQARVKKVWAKEGGWECSLAGKMASDKIFRTPVPKFGSSDCRCKTHLFLILKPGKEADLFRQNNFFLFDLGVESGKFPEKGSNLHCLLENQ